MFSRRRTAPVMNSAIRRRIREAWDRLCRDKHCYVLAFNPARTARLYRTARREVLRKLKGNAESALRESKYCKILDDPSILRVGPRGSAQCFRKTCSAPCTALPVKLRKKGTYRIGIHDNRLTVMRFRDTEKCYRRCFRKNLRFIGGHPFVHGPMRSVAHCITSHGITMRMVKSLKRVLTLIKAGRGIAASRLLSKVSEGIFRACKALCY